MTRRAPNAKITPFKPMANGMVFDARFFSGETVKNDAGADYNAHSMYRFYANKDDGTGIGNAEVFAAMDMLDLTPDETRQITLADFQSADPDRQAMAMMQIGDLADRQIGELSGGQQQRVAVARALIKEPDVVLADEPTANLDSATGRGLLEIMQRMNREKQVTFIFSTHDARVVKKARRVITLEDGKVLTDERKN